MGFRKHGFSFALLLFCMSMGTLTAGPALSDVELNKLLDTLEKKLSQIKTLRADFKQDKHISLFDETLTADGRLLFENSGNIRFEITKPFKSILIVAGKEVAKYEQSKGGWRKLQLKNADALALVMKQIGEWMNGKFRSQSRIFGLSAESRKEGVTYLILKAKPKQFAKLIKQIEIELSADRSHFTSITICESGGDSTVLRFLVEKRNIEIGKGIFDITRETPVEINEALEK